MNTFEDIACKPYYLHLELTNLCNANCVFCGYQYQQRPIQTMGDSVFSKALSDFLSEGGGSVTLTPIVGDALIDPQFLDRVRRLRSEPKIDRIRLITNGILLDRFGISEIVHSGLDFLAISTAGFDEMTYERVFRSRSYSRMRDNVLSLLECNEKAGRPIRKISVFLRSDRPYEELIEAPDFQKVLSYNPGIHYSRLFSSVIKRIGSESLPAGMGLYSPALEPHVEACQKLYDSPIVLPDGTVLACDCFSAMDAITDLAIGNVLQASLGDIWRGSAVRRLRESFAGGNVNPTCAACDNYQPLDLYRSEEGQVRAELNRSRKDGNWKKRSDVENGFWLNP